jgi:hypothetical protein
LDLVIYDLNVDWRASDAGLHDERGAQLVCLDERRREIG